MLFLRARAAARLRNALFQRVVVGLGGPSASGSALPLVRAFLRCGASVTVAACHDGAVEASMLPRDAETIAAVLRSSDVDVTGSGPARTLLRLADDRDADLIAVASHGRGGIGRANRVALGSEPTRLIADSTRPGIVVPASGAASFGHVAPACLRASA